MSARADGPVTAATPVRDLQAPVEEGVRLLAEVDVGYADGAEAEVLRILRDTGDLSSTSDELRARARNWPEKYHFDPARANVLRALDVPTEARVLEVGCGCGAVTRWLGETVALVDAVEPMLPRARAAAERTRDLDTVQVFCGGLDEVPAEPAYDLVVVVGVLEYVGHGTSDEEPYVAFLRGLEARLRPGGTVVLAIENALGVKYLSGAGEDHSGRPWESLEGYAPDAPARTFTDRRLVELFAAAGLDATAHGIFPDYKLPRSFVARRALERSDRMTANVPRFPSPDWDHPRVRTVSEGALWRTLVEAGTAAAHPNSFVVLAGRPGETRAPLLAEDVSAVILNTSRRAAYMSRTVFRGGSGTGTVRRELLLPDSGPAEEDAGGPRYLAGEEPLQQGDDLLHLASRAPDRLAPLLRGWTELLDQLPDDRLEIDHVPHNVLVRPDGSMVFIDSEWSWASTVDRSWVLGRGVLWSANALAHLTYPSSWPGAETVGDLAEQLAGTVGLPSGWREPALEAESRYQAAVAPRRGRSDPEEQAYHHGELLSMLEQPLAGMPLGQRVHHELQRQRELRADAVEAHARMEGDRDHVRRQRDEAETRAAALAHEVDDLRADVARLNGEVGALRQRRVVRLADGAARAAGRLRKGAREG